MPLMPPEIAIIITVSFLTGFIAIIAGIYNFFKYQELIKKVPNSPLCARTVLKSIVYSIMIPLVCYIVIYKTLQMWAVGLTKVVPSVSETGAGYASVFDPLTHYFAIHLFFTFLLFLYVEYIGYINKWNFYKIGLVVCIAVLVISIFLRSFLVLGILDLLLIFIFAREKIVRNNVE